MAEAERAPIAPRLVRWAARHGRHDLPWQNPATPYRVWVSEIMLQQTQVGTVIPYFERFTARLPSLERLAQAELSEVLALWSGLGYYARARNLHAAARLCRERHGGALPTTPEELAALPGIGRSTAGAILALACGRRAAILDGNAKRVLARYHAVSGWPGRAATARELWRLAETETPAARTAQYTQAIMDLGARVCTRNAPACGACPIAADCAAHLCGCETAYPAPRPTRPRPVRRRSFAWIRSAGALLLEERPPAGVWGGLLCLPELAVDEDPTAWCGRTFGRPPLTTRELDGFRHEFTHFVLEGRVIALEIDASETIREASLRWLEPASALAAGLPTPMRRYIHAHAAAAA